MKKMNNKGFTLIEIITVLIILTVVVITIYPIVINRVDSSRKKAYDTQIKVFEKAAEDWAVSFKNLSSIPMRDGETLTLNLGDLKIGGFLDMDIVNPITNKSFPNDMLITITKKGNQYDIVVIEDSGTDVEEENIIVKESPTIVLNGGYLMYLELGDTYEEQWANAYSYDGVDLSEEVTRQITLNGSQKSSIDTSEKNTYKIYYIIEDQNNGFRNSAIRTVIVRDTTPPILNFEETTTISLSQATNFNLMSGVTVSDNSRDNVAITHSGTVERRVGSYIITYTATDSSNNTSVKKRIIKVQ